jgi:hypothetical protein
LSNRDPVPLGTEIRSLGWNWSTEIAIARRPTATSTNRHAPDEDDLSREGVNGTSPEAVGEYLEWLAKRANPRYEGSSLVGLLLRPVASST